MIAGGASIISFNMSEDDVVTLMQQPWTMGSTDGDLTAPGPAHSPAQQRVHGPSRSRYSAISGRGAVEHTVRTMTSLPARVFGFEDRGEIRAGAFADIVVFNLEWLRDRATYQSPHPDVRGLRLGDREWPGRHSERRRVHRPARAGKILEQ